MGIITAQKQFSQVDKITVSAFCRRRLPIVMCRLKMAETVKEAVTFVEQGHIRVGPETVSDPAYLVTRNMEDFVTWVDTSKIKRKIMKYNDKVSIRTIAVFWGMLEMVFYTCNVIVLTHFFLFFVSCHVIVGRLRSFVKQLFMLCTLSFPALILINSAHRHLHPMNKSSYWIYLVITLT
jgi:ribosomal protein S4